MSTYCKGSLEPLGTFLPVGIETLGYLLPQPGVCESIFENDYGQTLIISSRMSETNKYFLCQLEII